MTDPEKYTRNLVVRPKREAAQINPETEEAFEESRELVKESVHKAAATNKAFVVWLGIFCYRLGKHGLVSITRRIFGKKKKAPVLSAKKNPPKPSRPSSGHASSSPSGERGKKSTPPR